MEDTFTLDEMMVPSTDTQGAFTLDEMNMPEHDFNKPQQLGYFESIAESFMRGERSWQTDKLGYEALQKGKSFYESNVRPAEDKLYEDMAKKRLAPGGMIKQAGLSLAEMAPGLIRGGAGGVVGGSVAGLGAAAVGSLLPIPEEIVTVPVAFGAGFTVGSAKEWYEQGAGNLYNSMAREGVPDEIAQPTAHIAGALYSAIEFAQFHKYIPGGKEASKKLIASTVQNTIKNVVKKYGTNWAENVFEEGLQEIVNESAKEYAKAVSGKSDTATGDKVLNVMTKGWQAMKSSALPMLLLLAPSMGKAAIDVTAKEKPVTQPVETVPSVVEPVPAVVEPATIPTAPEIVEPVANVSEVAPTETVPQDMFNNVNEAVDILTDDRSSGDEVLADAAVTAWKELFPGVDVGELDSALSKGALKDYVTKVNEIYRKTTSGAEQASQKPTPAPKMIEKEFVEEYEEAPASLEEEYKRAHKERTEQTASMSGEAGKYKRGRGFQLSATLRQYRGEPTATEIKNELKKLKTISVGKTVDTSDGIGVVTKNPAYGKVQVEVNGRRKVYIMEDVAPPKPTKEDAIASLKAKSEKEMRKYLKDIGREYTPTAIKRTRVIKKMVPAEKAEKKPADIAEQAPLPVERSDEQIRAGLLADYLGGTEAKGGLIFAEDGPSRVIGAYSNERPKWFKDLEIPMERATGVLNKFSKGEKLTETEQRDLNSIIESGGKKMSESMMSKEDVDFIRRKEKAIESGATEEEAIEIANSEMKEDAMDIAGIVDDEAWVEGIPAEPSPVLETPAKEPKIAKAASDVVTQMVEEGFNQLSEVEQAKYSPIEKKAKLEAAADLLANDYERAKRIAFGEEASGIADAQIVFNAVKNRAIAEGDMDTQMRLAESSVSKARSEAAQALGAAGYDNGLRESDPVSAMVEISKTREKETKKSIGESKISAEKKVGVEGIRKYTSKELKAMDWNAFIKELEC